MFEKTEMKNFTLIRNKTDMIFSPNNFGFLPIKLRSQNAKILQLTLTFSTDIAT